ncbi:MAG: type II secretion system F family protein [Clostridiales bacterium]|nr:type II secretion system F family protein [Clostridiales bacterium]MBQ2155179.1 type II secretion system F family protein [Clostridiales bacterium]MBQ5518609.1 type II secretion system F family protein [Clostridiales bacterium]
MNVSQAMKISKERWLTVRKSSHPFAVFLAKTIWVYPVFVAVVYFASGLFISSETVRLILAVALSIFPWKEAMKKIYSNNYRHMRTQLLVLLQVLTTSVSSGYSIEKSLLLIRPVIERTFGRRSMLLKPLINLENNLKLHVSLEESLNTFAKQIAFPETVPVFHALAISGEIGNNSLSILRSSCQMLSELNAVQGEIAASNAGKNAEAAILCAMPFGVTFALNYMSREYLDMARNTRTGSFLLALAFGVCTIACAMLLKFMSHEHGRKAYKSELAVNLTSGKAYSTPLTKLVKKIFPASFITARHELFNELSVNPDYTYEQYLKKQLLTGTVFLALSASILITLGKNPLFALFLTAALLLLGGFEIRSDVERKREDLMSDIPLFLCLISTLLESGMQLPKAISICAKAFDENKSLSLEIKNLRAMILSGIPASDAIEKFSLRIQIPEAQAALLLVARYGRLGTSEVLNMLNLQSQACWNLCRNASRKRQEREALGMIIPMTLDFISVLMVAMTPAIISLGI